MDRSIQWFYDRLGKTFYSMAQRNGQLVNNKYGFDCSSSVYYALNSAGLLPNLRIGNTDSLFRDLEQNGWVRLGPNSKGNYDTKRGDIFIWGVRGASGGAAGHTGQFVNDNDVIHCAAFSNGITVTNYDQLAGWNGWPTQTFYRYVGKDQTPAVLNPVDQDLEVGSWIVLENTYSVHGLELHDGIWQVRTNELCPKGFTWAENGIPAEPLVEVDQDGYRTKDQDLIVGSQYILPGKYQVLDLGPYEERWTALIEWNGLKFWIDVESVTEVAADHPGKSSPSERPQPTEEPTKVEDPVKEEVPEPEKEETKPEEPNKEEPKVAFTKEDQEALAVQTKKLQDIADDISESDGVTEITDSIPQKVKVAVYVVGDSLIGAGLLVPGLAVVFELGTVQQIAALAGVLATAGGFILTMFGIYKSKK